tara:strand:+ start:158 stop:790 length:633 start_codon:yes stop_codon:yes gene_type:complete
MKILALSDIHRDISFIKDMARKGKENAVDLVILAGDLADDNGRIDGMIGPFKKHNLEVAILPGNHEGLSETYFLTEHYKIKHLHGNVIKNGKIGIFGCGYADVGVHQLTEKEFFQTLKQAHEKVKDCEHKIMVSHVQPSDSILGINMWPGSTGVRKAVEELQPSLHICGHIHETHGMEDKIKNTRIINVGKTGTLIEINQENGKHTLSRL